MQRKKIAAFIIIFIILFVFFLQSAVGCAENNQPGSVSDSRFLLDTLCTITIYAPDSRELLERAFELIEHYEALFSISIEGSDIWRINHAGGQAVAVAPETAELLAIGLEYGRLSQGKFDITIGRLSGLWDFTGASGIPNETELSFALSTVDYRQVEIEGNKVALANPYAKIDLGGIAKGFILDRVFEFLRQSGAAGAVIDLGGDVAVLNSRPDGSPWRLGVRAPFSDDFGLLGVIEVQNVAVVTSGVYERRFEEGGVIFHHILDPQTGMPAVSDVISATIVSSSATAADALSSIIILGGSEIAQRLINESPEVTGALLVLESREKIELGDINISLR